MHWILASDSWHNIIAIIVGSPRNIIQSQFIGRGVCNKLINLSNEINCSTASIYPDYLCIYTTRKPSVFSAENGSTCGCLWVICWLWGTSSHQTAIKPSPSLHQYLRCSVRACLRLSVGDTATETWFMRTPTSAHHAPLRPFVFHLKMHTLMSERGSRLTQIFHDLQFSLNFSLFCTS